MVSGQLADTPTRGLPTHELDNLWTGYLADWSTQKTSQLLDWASRRLDNSRMLPAVLLVVMAALCNRGGHYIFAL